MRTRVRLLLWLFLLIAQAGCHQIIVQPGHYEGVLLQRKSVLIEQNPISAELSYSGNRSIDVAVFSKKGARLLFLRAFSISKTGFQLMISGVFDSAIYLKPTDNDCYFYSGEKTVEVCLTKNRFILEIKALNYIPILTLSGDQFSSESRFAIESPTSYSLSDAITRAMSKNFESRIQYEHLFQAKHAAHSAYLNLLPSLSLSTILSAATSGAGGLYTSVSDLAPFLLPTRWFQSKEASLNVKIERDTFAILQANLASEVEGLAYILERDKQLLIHYQTLLDQAKTVREKVALLEDQKQMPEGSKDDLDAVVSSMTMDLAAIELVVRLDRSALAQAMGLHNPEGISDISLGLELVPIDKAVPLDKSEVSRIALARSFEVRQIDSLIEVARYQKREVFFSWLDPSAGGNPNIGFGLGESIKIAESKVRELQIRKEQVQAQLVQKVYESVAEYSQSLQSFKLSTQNGDIHERRLKRIISQIQPGANVSTIDVGDLFEQYLASLIRRESLLASFRIARSKVDRFLLQGFYLQKRPKIQVERNVRLP